MRVIPGCLVATIVTMSMLPTAGFAATIGTELGDAGQLPATAQIPVGSGPLTSITGALSFGDVDLYQIFVTGGGTFSAFAQGEPPFFSLDPSLFLFDSAGLGVYANAEGFFAAALLPAGNPLTPIAPGLYYLGISTPHLDPVNASVNIFPCVGVSA